MLSVHISADRLYTMTNYTKLFTDSHGVHFAQEISGNVSIKEIFRYAKPSQEEMQTTIEELYSRP